MIDHCAYQRRVTSIQKVLEKSSIYTMLLQLNWLIGWLNNARELIPVICVKNYLRVIPLCGNRLASFFCHKTERDYRIQASNTNFVDTKPNISSKTLLNFFQTITKSVLKLFDLKISRNKLGYFTHCADCDVYLVLVVLLLRL